MKVKNLTFRHHKKGPYFFKDLSFELEEGRLHALHGKNGVGKSVLLNILINHIDKEAHLTGEISQEKVMLVNQQFDQTLVDKFTFLENLQFATLPSFPNPFSRLPPLSHPIQGQFFNLIQEFHIDLTLPVYTLSGGQRQILALLMKLQREAKVLLLDEPTATLDEQNATLVFEFLKRLKGVTLLVVCHDKELLGRYTTGKNLCLEINSEGVRELRQDVFQTLPERGRNDF